MIDRNTATPLSNMAAMAPLPIYSEERFGGFGLVSVIDGFQPGTDRLMLDFNPGATLPVVTFDMALEPGSTAVMGNGRLMAVLRGVTGVAISDIRLRELPSPDDWREDANPAKKPLKIVDSFNPVEEVIEVFYQPGQFDQLDLRVEDFSDGTGATVWLNNTPVIAVRGAQGLTPADIVLVPQDAQNA